ncbi:SHOCT domain-containing protein [Chloroflexota bacterium]
MWGMHEFGGWWMLFGGVWMLIFGGGVIIGLIVWGIIKLTKSGENTPTNSPLDIAKQRYARGEINKEEFEQIKKDLY